MNARILLAIAISAGLPGLNVGRAAQPDALVLEARIPLGNVQGRIDHLAYDAQRQRLYVAELGNNSVGIVDLKAGVTLRTVAGFDEPQGVAYEATSDTVYVANGGDGSVRIFGGEDFAPAGRVDLGGDADNVRVDPVTHRVYVGFGDGGLAIVDARTRRRIASIGLQGHPESFQLLPDADAIVVNVPDAGQITVVSRTSLKQTAHWKTDELRANFPLLLDVKNGRAVSVFRRPPRLQAYDLLSGRSLAGTGICGDSDDLFLDPQRSRIYVVCGEGYLDVVASSGESFSRVGRVKTAHGARTGLFVPESGRLFVAVPASGAQSASVWVFRTNRTAGD